MTKEEFQKIFDIASKHYPQEILNHAISVSEYVEQDPRFFLLPEDEQWLVKSIAIAHDLLEDTSCSMEELTNEISSDKDKAQFIKSLDSLTRREYESYPIYIDRIVSVATLFALMVKQSDMKDHLARKETLTPSLKKRYKQVIPLLIGR